MNESKDNIDNNNYQSCGCCPYQTKFINSNNLIYQFLSPQASTLRTPVPTPPLTSALTPSPQPEALKVCVPHIECLHYFIRAGSICLRECLCAPLADHSALDTVKLILKIWRYIDFVDPTDNCCCLKEEARVKAEAETRSRADRDRSNAEDEAILRAAGVLSLTVSLIYTHSVISLPLSIPHSWCICAFCVFSKLCNISSPLLSRLLLLSLYSSASP